MGSSPIKFCRAVSEELEPGRLQKKFLTALLDLQNVERGSIWVRRGNSYQCVQAAGSESEGVIGLSVPVDRPSIVGWVIENGKMTIAEAGKDSRHYKEAEIGITLKSKLILCFPLVLRDGTVYGAMELIDTSAGGDRLNLDPAYLELLQQLIDLGSIALSNSFIHSDQQMENVKLKETLEAIRSGDMILGKSEAFQKVLKTAENYARTDFPVLITGESGTGKELLAKEIHRLSSRRAKPFLTQNCSAIPDTLLESELFGYEKGAFTGATRDRIGLFEAANGGSLFLDEIGDMPIHLQARMLRFLQSGEVKPLGSTRTRKVDVRIISATNKDLKGAIKKELFREDLFYRLNVLPVHLPSLRERREDIPLLLDHFLKREALKLEIPPKRLSEEALRYAVNHPWRGNIRELENFAKHISVVVGGEVIRPNDLSIHLVADQDQLPSGAATGPGERDAGGEAALSATSLFEGRSWDEIEKAYALYLLEKHLWHISRAAKEAGVNRSTFDSRLRRLGISRARTGPGSGQAFSTK